MPQKKKSTESILLLLTVSGGRQGLLSKSWQHKSRAMDLWTIVLEIHVCQLLFSCHALRFCQFRLRVFAANGEANLATMAQSKIQQGTGKKKWR